MSNNRLYLTDPNFKMDASGSCQLLLKITNDSFSYAVLNNNTKEINLIFDRQGCTNLEQDLKSAFETDQYLSLNYSVIKACVHTSNLIFIPNELLNTDLNVYSKYLGSTQKIHSKESNLGFNTVFSVSSGIGEQLPKDAILLPQSAPLFEVLKHLPNHSLLIDFTASSFNVLYIKDGRVNFQNHFPAETADEFNYFLLLMIKELGLDDKLPIYIQGIVNEDDDYYNCLLKYFNGLYFFQPVNYEYSDLLTDMPKHYFSGLLALDLCE